MSLSFDAAGTLRSLSSDAVALDGLDPDRDIGRAAAARAASERVLGAEAPEAREPLASRVVLAGPGGARLAWRVIVPTIPMIQKIVCIVDAETGDVIKLTDEVIR